MKKYQTPMLELMNLEEEDVLTTSGMEVTGENIQNDFYNDGWWD